MSARPRRPALFIGRIHRGGGGRRDRDPLAHHASVAWANGAPSAASGSSTRGAWRTSSVHEHREVCAAHLERVRAEASIAVARRIVLDRLGHGLVEIGGVALHYVYE